MVIGECRTPCKNGGGIVRAGEISGRNMSEGAMSYTLGERIPSDLYPLPAKDSLREFLHFIASVKARSHMTIGIYDDRFANTVRRPVCNPIVIV